MSCDIYRNLMMKYFDDDINDVESAQLRQHTKICKSCREEFEQLKDILESFKSDSLIEPPPDFQEQVMAKINSLEDKRKRNIEAVIYGIPILIFISLPVFLLFRFSGSRILDAVIDTFEYFMPFTGVADVIGDVISALGIIVSSMRERMAHNGRELMKSYNDVLMMLVVVLIFIEWLFIKLVKRSWGKASR